MKKIKSFYLGLGIFVIAGFMGQAFLKTQGGDVKTCAGNEIYLEPDRPNDWVSSLLLSDSFLSTANSAAGLSDMKKRAGLDTTDIKEETETLTAQWKRNYFTRVKKNVLVTACDSQGNFEFNNIKMENILLRLVSNGKQVIKNKVAF